jgi:adenosylcobinamide-GDP ribazoletransferase
MPAARSMSQSASIEPPPSRGDDQPRAAPPCLRGARAAVVFLTRVPLGGFPYRDADWRWASAWFPVVGALVGALCAEVFVLTRAAGATVAGALAVLTALLATGAMHEDGLCDTADALGGAGDRERLLAILKDSRIGVFGAAALTMSLLLRVALLSRLDAAAPVALIAVGAWSRAAPVWLMARLPYVTPAQTARSTPLLAAGARQAAVATAAAAVIGATAAAFGLMSWPAVPVLPAVCAGLTLVAGWRFQARAAGVTGDFLGATQQLCECGLLLALALLQGQK